MFLEIHATSKIFRSPLFTKKCFVFIRANDILILTNLYCARSVCDYIVHTDLACNCCCMLSVCCYVYQNKIEEKIPEVNWSDIGYRMNFFRASQINVRRPRQTSCFLSQKSWNCHNKRLWRKHRKKLVKKTKVWFINIIIYLCKTTSTISRKLYSICHTSFAIKSLYNICIKLWSNFIDYAILLGTRSNRSLSEIQHQNYLLRILYHRLI